MNGRELRHDGSVFQRSGARKEKARNRHHGMSDRSGTLERSSWLGAMARLLWARVMPVPGTAQALGARAVLCLQDRLNDKGRGTQARQKSDQDRRTEMSHHPPLDHTPIRIARGTVRSLFRPGELTAGGPAVSPTACTSFPEGASTAPATGVLAARSSESVDGEGGEPVLAFIIATGDIGESVGQMTLS